MQADIKALLNRGHKRSRVLKTCEINNALNRNSHPGKARLISIINTANSNLHKKPKVADPTVNSSENKPANSDPLASMHGPSFTQPASTGPSFIPKTTQAPRTTFHAPPDHHASYANVQGAFNKDPSSSQRENIFSQSTARRAAAEATWRATAGTKRNATSRMQREHKQEQSDFPSKLAAEKERIAKELKQKEEELRAKRAKEEALRRQAQFRMFQEESAYAYAYAYATAGPDIPHAQAAGSAGADSNRAQGPTADAYHRRDFNFDDPDDCWGFNGAGGHFQSEYCRAEENNGDTDGRDSFYYSDEEEASRSEGDTSNQEEDEEEDNGYFNGWGSGPWANSNSNGGFSHGHARGGSDDHWAGHNGENGNWYRSGEWEEFKRNWHQRSREYHSEYYYTHENNPGNRYRGRNENTNGGKSAAPGVESGKICQVSAAHAAGKALEVAQRAASGSEVEEERLKEEIHSFVQRAAEHAGHDVTAFALALQIQVDTSRGPDHAKKMAKKGLLMAFHPDKLGQSAARQQWLGTCVTQILNAKVK